MGRARRGSAWALLLLLAGACPPPLKAQQPATPEIIESERRSEVLRLERLRLRQELTRIRSRVSDPSTELENLARQAGTAAGLVQELEFQVASREEQIERNAQDLVLIREHLAQRRDVLHRRLRDIYTRGPLQTIRILLAAESFSDLLNRHRYLFLIARHDRHLADDVAYLERQLVARERALRSSLARLESLHRERSAEQGYVAAMRAEQRLTLTSGASSEPLPPRAATSFERDEGRLIDLLRVIEQREPTLPSVGDGSRGVASWPVEGPLVYRFGDGNPIDGSTSRGIGIGAPPGTPVGAVAAGRVVLSGRFEAYGPTVVLGHGGGFHTIYLFLGETRVRQGEDLHPGQTVGTAGMAPGAATAYFELQLRTSGGAAVDPLTWLRRP